MEFKATLKKINGNVAPQDFLRTLVKVVKRLMVSEPETIAPNDNYDLFSVAKAKLGPFPTMLNRAGVVCEFLRNLASRESSFNWNAGKDPGASNWEPWTMEAGIFQCSSNSMYFSAACRNLFKKKTGLDWKNNAEVGNTFRALTKADHEFAIEFVIKLLRETTAHHGPIGDGLVTKEISREAAKEFEAFLSETETIPVETDVPKEVARVFAAMKASSQFKNPRYIAEIDYSINSKYHRLWIYDRELKKLETHKVAHGRGGKNETPHDGKCREVSNMVNSHMSCLGLFKCAETYDGKNGLSMRLDGLSSTNSNARKRAIVVHGDDYVNDANTAIAGRSWGCPAVGPYKAIIAKLKNGSPLLSHYKGKFEI